MLAKIQIYRGERGGRGGNLFIAQGFLRDLRDLCGEKSLFCDFIKIDALAKTYPASIFICAAGI
jgi:hypothetical protein